MKIHPAYIAAPVFLIAGVFAGREFFPKILPAPEPGPPSLSTRGKRKIIRAQRSESSDLAASPTDIKGLLELVDTSDPFHSSTRLRAALGDRSPGALESLLLEIDDSLKSDARGYTLRMSLINHLVAKDPFHALDFVLAHEDPSFKSGFIQTIMRGAARVDLNAARQAIALIDDPRTKQLAEVALINTDAMSSSEDLLALLEGSTIIPSFNHYQHGMMWGSWDNSWGGGYYNYSVQASGALVKLAQQDLAAAEKYARELKTNHERNNAMMQIANGLAQSDPDLALEWARNLENSQSRNQTLSSVIGIIASDDPNRAIALSEEVTNPRQRDSIISTIASSWAANDPGAAIDWLKTLPKTKATIQAASNAAVQMSQTDPLGAIAVLETLPGTSRQNFLSNIVNNWSNRDFEGAKNWIIKQDDPATLQQILPNVLSNWVNRDPASVANFLASKTSEDSANIFANQYSTIGSYWANKDRTAALNWANGLEDKDLRQNAIGGIYQTWASANPADAAQHLGSISNPEDRQQLLTSIAGSWASQDPEAAQDWLNTLPGNDRFEAARSTISSLGHASPRTAAELFDRMALQAAGNEEEVQRINHQASSIASNWSNHAPKEAATWAAGITSEDHQANAYRSIASNWTLFDPPATATWIDTLPPGTPRDRATERLVDHIKQQDPSAAFDWANSMNDDNQRYNSIRNVVNQWKRTNPEAAREAIGSASITPDQQEKLLSQIK
ncbi:hypothetical protein N9Y81_02670 [Akkermansiaceae bacterium]|jgi:hypothetical protein|nr:hypothetical protein [Akkermansiaceae bacterium]